MRKEMIVGWIGGILAVGVAFLTRFFGLLDESVRGSSDLLEIGNMALLFSILSIIGLVVSKYIEVVGGCLMIISAIGGLISLSPVFYVGYYTIPALLLIIVGVTLCLKRKK